MLVGPWLCIGDFNEICSNREKVGGKLRNAAPMERLRRVIDENCLVDFGNVKREMTCYGRGVMERLDRALCNDEWLRQFPSAKVRVLDWLCSDHRPIVVTFTASEERRRCWQVKHHTRFHYEEAWAEDKKCKNIISDSWGEGGRSNNSQEIKRKILRCGDALKIWNVKQRESWNRETKKGNEGA